VRIGIAHDQAFGFYYSEDLDSLRAANVELVELDTLHGADAARRGRPHHRRRLSRNVHGGTRSQRPLRKQIRSAIEAGLPTYAECGGLMYLSKSLSWQGQTREMVGVVPGDTVMHERPVGRGYARLQPTGDDRWQETASIPAHEFHYSSLENLPADSIYAYRGHARPWHRRSARRLSAAQSAGRLRASPRHRRAGLDRAVFEPGARAQGARCHLIFD
jgi:cobyrinic acid a,c-diamide synthase